MNDEYKVYVSLQDGYITSINSEIFASIGLITNKQKKELIK